MNENKCFVCGKNASNVATITGTDGKTYHTHVCDEHALYVDLLVICLQYNQPMSRVVDFFESMNNMLKEEKETLEDMRLECEDLPTDEMCIRALERLIEIMCTNKEVLVPTFRAWLGIKEN